MRLLLPWLVCLTMFTGSFAQQKMGNVSFTAPKGWVSSSIQGGVQYTLKNASGEADRVIMVGQDMAAPADPAAWLNEKALSFVSGVPLQETSLESEKLPSGLTFTSKALVGGTADAPVVYLVGLLHNSTSAVLLAGLTGDPSKAEMLGNEMDAVAKSVKFTGTPLAGGKVSGATASTSTSSTGKLPDVPPMNAAQFKVAGGNPDTQLIPDEYRCYAEVSGQSLAPDLIVQILSGGKYRTVYGSGNVQVKKGGSLENVTFTGGPLDESVDYLHFDNYGQAFGIDNLAGKSLDLQCYQRGAKENQMLRAFKLRTPKEGKYACAIPDGSGKSGGTLEILANNAYRWNGSLGRFSVDFRSDQDHDWSDLDFTGGALDDVFGSYRENEDGARKLSVGRSQLECQVIAKPTPPVKYGPNKAPALPAGSGGLSGTYVHARAGTLIPTINGGLMSECPGNMCWTVYTFQKNGYVYTDEPETDLNDADCSRTYPNGLPVCEVYRVKNGQITVGNQKPEPFKQTGNNIVLDGKTYYRLQPLDGLKLSGAYKSTNVMPALIGTGGSISTMYLKFSKQGQFMFDRDFSANFSGDYGGVAVSNTQASRGGTYDFKGNTLTLKYADGRVIKMFALALTENGKLDYEVIRLGGSTYTLQK